MNLMEEGNVSLGDMDRWIAWNLNHLRGIVSADDRLLSIDGALCVYTWHRLRRGSATVQLVRLAASTSERCVGARVVADTDISGDAIACEMTTVSSVRITIVLVRTGNLLKDHSLGLTIHRLSGGSGWSPRRLPESRRRAGKQRQWWHAFCTSIKRI